MESNFNNNGYGQNGSDQAGGRPRRPRVGSRPSGDGSYANRSYGSKPNTSRDYSSSRDAGQGGEYKPRNSYGENRSGGYNRSEGGYNREGGQRRSYGENRSEGGYNRDGGQRRSYGENRSEGGYNRSANGNREGGYNRSEGGYNRDGGQRRSYGENRSEGGYNRSANGNREGGYNRSEGGYNRDGGQRRSYGENRSEGGYNRDGGQRRSYGDNNNRREGGYNGNRSNQGFRNNSRFNNDNYDPNAKYSQKKQIEYKKQFVDYTQPMRLNKFLANAGLCSRREADEFIQAGVVTVNGNVINELGAKVIPATDKILFHDQLVRSERRVYILLNKPKDCVTTVEDTNARMTVLDLVRNACSERVYPVGRLDRNSTGVLLITNDGDLTSKLTHPKYNKKKIYQVTLDKDLEDADFEKIAMGLTLEDGDIKVDEISFINEDDRRNIGIEIHSGKNRIVRRIFDAVGYHVIKLDRVYFAGLTKKNLPRGRWRHLSEMEVNMLKMSASAMKD